MTVLNVSNANYKIIVVVQNFNMKNLFTKKMTIMLFYMRKSCSRLRNILNPV